MAHIASRRLAHVTAALFPVAGVPSRHLACEALPAAETASASSTATTAAAAPTAAAAAATTEAPLSATEFRKFPLISKENISHNVRRFRFALPRPTDGLGLPVGQHISLRATIGGKTVMRPYTPTTSDADRGHFDLVVKVYPQGAMSQHLDGLALHECIEARGPKGRFVYAANRHRHIAMLAGGTGITPMLQVLTAIAANPADTTAVSLVFGNVTRDDILLEDAIVPLLSGRPGSGLYHVLNNPPPGWTQGVGFITEQIIRERCPPPSDDTLILICGPGPMTQAMTKLLDKMGYAKTQYFAF